ncbi:MAG: hypothetical protein N2645_15150 [Clostridia bacterium]|nr:hypothetical protein [Clostridia bacterium]
MSRLTRIESELKSLEGGRFQNLCNELLFALGYGKITKSGGQIGTDKTIKGTPDSFILLPNGKFVDIEYTVQEKGVYEKFDKDIDKCLDKNKTGISREDIYKIIVCYNTVMSQEELKLLVDRCKSNGVLFEHFDISVISQYLNNKFPYIAKEYFGIEIDSGQVISYDVFIKPQRNVIFSTPLDNEFMFREDEMKSMLEKLENNDVIIVYGKAGIGKTRLSLEVMKNYVNKHPEFEVYCLSSNGENIYSDLQTYFSGTGSYILLIDDANRFERISNIVKLVQKNNFKLILTVRDYALMEVETNLQDIMHDTFELEELSDENLKKILMSESIGIKNHLYLDRICTVSSGNPRLAIMAAIVAKEQNTIESLRDVSNIYRNYFGSILEKVTAQSPDLLITLGILCYFQSLDKASETYSKVKQFFNFEEAQLWGMIRRLYELEVVDIYNNEVIKISDQVLATYFCYYTLIEEQIVDFSLVLNHFFYTYKEKMTDVIYPMLSTFDFTKVVNCIKPHIDRIWVENQFDEDKFGDIIDVFWFVKPLETLLTTKNQVDKLPVYEKDIKFVFPESKNYGHISDFNIKTIKKLTNFDDYLNMSFDLLFQYLEKKPDVFLQVMAVIKESVFYDLNSYYHDYRRQKEFVCFIVSKAKSNKLYGDFLYNLSFDFLKIHHSDVSQKLFKQREVLFTNFNIELTDGMKELRTILLEGLFMVLSKSNIGDFINKYIQSLAYNLDKEIVIYDFNYFSNFFMDKLDNLDYMSCSAINKYIDFLEFNNIEDDRLNELRGRFRNDTVIISKLLYDEYDRRELILEDKYTHEQIEELREQNIKEYFKDYDINQYCKLYEQLVLILQNAQGHTEYQYYESIGYILKDLIIKSIHMYFEFIEYIIQHKNEIKISYPMCKVLSENNPEQYGNLVLIIEKYDFQYRHEWLLRTFEYLPEEQINSNYIEKLKSVYRNMQKNAYIRFEALDKFYKYDKKLYSEVLHSLAEKLNDMNYNLRLLYYVPNILEKVNHDYNLLKTIYLYSCKNDRLFDHSGETMQHLLGENSDFILEYLSCLKGDNDRLSSLYANRQYKFIWKMDNYKDIIDKVIMFFSDEDENSLDRLNTNWHYINQFFGFDKIKENEYLKRAISENCKNNNIIQLIFIPISNIYFNESAEFVDILLKHNNDIDIFKALNFRRGGRVTSNEEKDIEDCINLWESFLPLTKSLEFLMHMEYICKMIEGYKMNLERARRRKYINEY